MNEVCALCLKAEPLVSSHVIPKFNFRQIKNGNGQYHVLSPDPKAPRRKDQTELREPLLCKYCDTVVVRDGETYLSKLLYGEPGTTGITRAINGEPAVWTLTNLDFGKVQRALISILWRMHVSKQDFFKQVDLGPKHSEAIRVSILNQTPVGQFDYPVSCAMPLLDGKHYTDILATPDVLRADGNRIYRCLISGFVFSFVIGSAELAVWLRPFVLQEDGTWPIMRDELEKMPAFYEPFARAAANRRRWVVEWHQK